MAGVVLHTHVDFDGVSHSLDPKQHLEEEQDTCEQLVFWHFQWLKVPRFEALEQPCAICRRQLWKIAMGNIIIHKSRSGANKPTHFWATLFSTRRKVSVYIVAHSSAYSVLYPPSHTGRKNEHTTSSREKNGRRQTWRGCPSPCYPAIPAPGSDLAWPERARRHPHCVS